MDVITLSKQARTDAIASIRRYVEENFEEPIGDLKAGFFLDYFLKEIGPAVYNQAIHDAQARLAQHVADLDGALFAEEFSYWQKKKTART